MTKKENLVSEMENLADTIKDYLKILDEMEIDETGFQRLSEGMFSVTWALQYYLDENLTDQAHAVGIDPDIQGMEFE